LIKKTGSGEIDHPHGAVKKDGWTSPLFDAIGCGMSSRSFPWIVVLLYAGLLAFIIPYHEPWRDETEIWVAVSDLSIRDLFLRYFRETGHPALWPLVLMPFARAGFPFATMYFVHAALAIGMVAIFVRFSPFSPLTKLLWAFSMPIAYEYAVIARNYSVTVLCLFVVAALYRKRFEKPAAYALAIFFLLQTHVLLFMTACALTLCYGLELRARRRDITKSQVAAWLFMALAILLTFLELVPLAGHPQNCFANHGTRTIDQWLVGISTGWLPALAEWLSSVDIRGVSKLSAVAVFLPLIIMGGIFLHLLDRGGKGRNLCPCAIFALSMVWIFYVEIFKHPLTLRQFALTAQIALFALWIFHDTARTAEGNESKTRPANGIFILINLCLFYACIATFFTDRWEYNNPFSASSSVAEFLKRNHLESHVIATDNYLLSLVPLLDRSACVWPTYAQHCTRGIEWTNLEYCRYIHEYPALTSMDLPKIARKFKNFSNTVLVFHRHLTDGELKGYGLALVYKQTGSNSENAWVYISKKEVDGLPSLGKSGFNGGQE
jgi:hypothetical protein